MSNETERLVERARKTAEGWPMTDLKSLLLQVCDANDKAKTVSDSYATENQQIYDRLTGAEADARRWREVATEHKGRADTLSASLAKCEAANRRLTKSEVFNIIWKHVLDATPGFVTTTHAMRMAQEIVGGEVVALTPAGTDETEGRS